MIDSLLRYFGDSFDLRGTVVEGRRRVQSRVVELIGVYAEICDHFEELPPSCPCPTRRMDHFDSLWPTAPFQP